jgi:hypothetical protein
MEENMESDDSFEASLSNDSVDEHLLDDATTEPPQGRTARQQRLEEFEMAGLDKPDHLEALLVCGTADLIDIAFMVGAVVKGSLAAAPATADTVQNIEPALNDLLRVTRQIDRFAQLELRLASERKQAHEARLRSQSAPGFAHLPQASRRSR